MSCTPPPVRRRARVVGVHNITAFPVRCVVAQLVGKAKCRPAQTPRSCRVALASIAVMQAVPSRARCALRVGPSRITALPCSLRCRLVSGQGGVAPGPGTRNCVQRRRSAASHVGTRPLRPPASLLHNAALPSVPASRCAKAPLGAGHRFAPCRVKATGVMQSGLRWSRSHSRQRFPVACTPYAPPSARPCGCRGTWALVRRCALCFGQWPTASHLVCAPAHPQGLARFAGIGPARSARPPPKGLPQPARLCHWVLLQGL